MNLPDLETPVRVTTAGGHTFTAQRRDLGFPDCDWCWVADEDDAPECWTDGICWKSNEDENPSDPVVKWEAI